MNRTVKDATVKTYHYPSIEALKTHVLAFVLAYNFAKHIKAIRWKTPFEYICGAWQRDPSTFKLNPHHLTPGTIHLGSCPERLSVQFWTNRAATP
jgi:hypothetical protein